MIVLEGIIGSGKSDTARALLLKLAGHGPFYHVDNPELVQELGQFALFPEPVNGNPYLEDFYKDPARWGLVMQFHLLAARFRLHEQAIQMEWNRKITTIFDRSIWGDRAFAYLLWKDCVIDNRGYHSYEEHFACMARFLLTPHLVVYLNVTIETALRRIAQRGRGCEKGIPASYLEKLDQAYKQVVLPGLECRGSNVVILDWNSDGIQENLHKIEELL